MQTNTTIQNYRLVSFIGEGGMGQVWLAEHTLLGRKVAIKALHPQLLRNAAIRARFKNEAATLAHLQHPNIVTLLDYIEDDHGAYLILEYVEGDPLDEYIQKKTGPIPEPRLKDLFSQILHGFIYAHHKRVVHRDVKPGNFLVTPDGRVKMLDFGIAKLLEEDRRLTKTGTSMGTVLYMSPEQVKGTEVDHRSDIYSLGVTLFHMATGQSAYNPESTEFIVYDQIVNHPLPPASAVYPAVSPGLETIIAKATAKLPQDRYQNCEAFLEDLNRLGQPTPITPPAPPATVSSAEASKSQPQAQAPIVAASLSTAPPPPVKEPVPAPQALPPKKRSRAWIWILVVLAVRSAAIPLAIIYGPGLGTTEFKYVIASNLYVRSKPSEDASTKVMIPYGTKVQVVGRPTAGWVEFQGEGKKGFLKESYLVEEKVFLELDALCANEEAKELMRESTHKLALESFFQSKGYRADLAPQTYQEVYGGSPDPSKIWYVKGLPSNRAYNTVIPYIKLEKGEYRRNEKKNNVVIIENKADPDQRRLVAFRYKPDGTFTDIGSMDLSAYSGQYIRAVSRGDLSGYEVETTDMVQTINAYFKDGREGIALGQDGEAKEMTLILWKGYSKFDTYQLTRRTFRWYNR